MRKMIAAAIPNQNTLGEKLVESELPKIGTATMILLRSYA